MEHTTTNMSKAPSLASIRILAFLLFLLSSVSALQVTPGSKCASVCLDQQDGNSLDPAASSNSPDDMVCKDVEFYSDANGLKFKSCVECLQNSEQVNGTENDISWFLYNLRYATSVCLWGWPTHKKNVSSPCDIDYACHPLQKALETGNLNPANETEYQYCTAGDSVFQSSSVQNCIQCLQASSDQNYMSNFLIALEAGCKQQPAPGQLLGLSGAIFSDYAVNITTPPSNVTAADTKKKDNGTMTTGTIVGIAVGTGLLFLGGLALFFVYWRKQQRYKREDSGSPDPYDKPLRSGSSSITATNSGTVPHYTLDYKSEPPSYELQQQQQPQPQPPAHIVSHFSSNADYYDDLENQNRGRPLPQNQPAEITSVSHHANSALPTHPAYVPRGYIGGRPSRNSSPNQRPRPKSNKPDSYAIQVYLNAQEDSKIPPPPPNPPQTRSTKPIPVAASRASQFAGPPAVSTSEPAPAPAPAPPPPPPPPQGQKKPPVPSLILPSVPRIRVPKKYPPPSIQIQDATPIESQGGNDRFAISGPLAFPDERFRNRSSSPNDRVVEHVVQPPQISPVPIGSGKSYLYG